MTFSTRNSYYLRISRDTVLVLYLYLDRAHVRWMTDYILQKVLTDLRTRIGPKLESEYGMSSNVGSSTGAKKSAAAAGSPTIDVHQGDDYQFCFFLRKTDHRHVVLLKHKRFVSRPIPPPPDLGFDDDDEGTPEPRRKGRKKGGSKSGKNKKEREGSVSSQASGSATGKKRRRAAVVESDDGEESEDGRSVREETMDYEEEEREESVESEAGPSRLRGGAGEEGPGRRSDEEMEDVDAAPSPPRSTIAFSFASVKADPDDPSLPNAHDLLSGPTSTMDANDYDDDDQAPLVALDFQNEEQEEQKPFLPDNGPFGGLAGAGAGGEDEKLFKPAMELTYTGFSIYEKQLCIVIEPWPALPPSLRRSTSSTRPSPSASPSPSPFGDRPPAQSRSGSIASNYHSSTPNPSSSSRRSASTSIPPPNSRKAGTPLFRPATPGFGFEEDNDGPERERERQEREDWRGRSVSVLPGEGRERSESVWGENEGGGMMGLSEGIFGSSQAMGRGEGRVGDGEEAEDGDGDGGEGGGGEGGE
ncbi:hypothetical protein BDY24DRAFT_444152 [Mrakia frigida]|uniref:uncharacterized protein n=1 Tax=Mrakia frigida TaxID=29902 RepID=UPI003FCBFD72